ncbi:MAG: iron-containing alcohol dehydrogenase [candidate division WOR-3 bacterium]
MSSINFEFRVPEKIIFGVGSSKEISSNALNFGKRPLIVTGKNQKRYNFLFDSFIRERITPEIYSVEGEPTTETIIECLGLGKRKKVDVVIGIGGGSAIDTGKAIAVLLTNEGNLFNYLEVIGKGKPFKNPGIPFIAVPTTAGTGAEVTKNAVIKSKEHSIKVSLRSNFMLPRIAIVDPALTYSMPKEITLNTGLDAFTQVIEPFVSNKSNPLTDSICKEGIKRISRSILEVIKDGSNTRAREDMCIGSLFGGIALANAKLGAVHGFAGALGGVIDVSHGLLCGILLPFVIKMNIKALKEREPLSPTLIKYKEIAKIVTGKEKAEEKDLISWIEDLYGNFNIPCLSELKLEKEKLEEIVENAKKSSSMQGNPIVLTDEELREIIKEAF